MNEFGENSTEGRVEDDGDIQNQLSALKIQIDDTEHYEGNPRLPDQVRALLFHKELQDTAEVKSLSDRLHYWQECDQLGPISRIYMSSHENSIDVTIPDDFRNMVEQGIENMVNISMSPKNTDLEYGGKVLHDFSSHYFFITGIATPPPADIKLSQGKDNVGLAVGRGEQLKKNIVEIFDTYCMKKGVSGPLFTVLKTEISSRIIVLPGLETDICGKPGCSVVYGEVYPYREITYIHKEGRIPDEQITGYSRVNKQ